MIEFASTAGLKVETIFQEQCNDPGLKKTNTLIKIGGKSDTSIIKYHICRDGVTTA